MHHRAIFEKQREIFLKNSLGRFQLPRLFASVGACLSLTRAFLRVMIPVATMNSRRKR